ncbi:tRNA (adenosine(37)-N6)-dimethylallyltransferase MiaA [Facilibium subflavum]|uniref:tRNA (adenosine(37)-N6)-dimethylallyltransferase MiaA n=1 Tax=Facilibium subflavum TaxID=2219058 RepID=UPI000E651CD6|nr:tRNA (adenosine(37)-N6)-dimethylallyltransferase MiaA [Facilibium subflavum]
MASSLIFALAGATASGKTNLSIVLAKQLNAEIISVDSALIYKKMDIGTAKPTLEEMQGIKHHLIDIVEPWQNYSVNHFLKESKACIQEIQQKGKNVLLVGGTMMYFKALVEGISNLPEADDALRQEIQQLPLETLYDFLQTNDSLTAQQLNPNDRQRIQRAYEVIKLTGRPYSQVLKAHPKEGGLGDNLKLCALVPSKRNALHDNIEKRFLQMLENGFLAEVKALKDNPKISCQMPSMRSVGYRQAWQYLDGEYDYDTFVAKGIAATRQLAKRQLTWIRNWPYAIKIIDANLEDKIKLKAIQHYFLSFVR